MSASSRYAAFSLVFRCSGGSQVSAQARIPGLESVAGYWMWERQGVEWHGISMPMVMFCRRVWGDVGEEGDEEEENSARR